MADQLIAHESVFDASPSAQVIYLVLKHRGELTQQEIRAEVGLSERSVRDALTDLVEMGTVRQRPKPGDARQSKYRLADPTEENAG